MRIIARAILAALVLPLVLVALRDDMPAAVRAATAALALVIAVVALFLPEPVDQAEIDGYTPAPVDPAVLMHHADQLCPVPAAARPPVDQLLARVPATPAEVDHVGAVELGVFALADRLDAYAEAQNATLNRFAELLADKVGAQDERIDRIDSRLDQLEQKLRGS